VTPPLFLLDVLPAGDELLLSGDEGRHAARVRRVQVGETVLVSDGRGGLLECTVTAFVGAAVRLRVVGRTTVLGWQPQLAVVQALPKGDRGELAVEVMTELGVDEIVPWSASRSIVQWRGDRGAKALSKWRSTAREASKQSRRARVPVVAELASTADVVRRIGTAAAALVLHADADATLVSAAMPLTGSVVVIIGPEGGIAPDELTAFADAGAVPVRLGATVLRTSTAGPAALAALSVRLGRWG
jgi:16S rRNA (uracil1498-N3)-methyltransferase